MGTVFQVMDVQKYAQRSLASIVKVSPQEVLIFAQKYVEMEFYELYSAMTVI